MLSLNEDYFEEIDKKTKAYWLGFILGDGYIVDINYNRRLGIGIKEKEHLEKFKNDIESGHKIMKRKKDDLFVFEITRKKIVDDLKNLGIEVDKSHKNIGIPDIPDKYMNHFVRGLFDADGSVSDNSFTVTGTKKIINQVNNEISKILNKINKVYKHKNGKKQNGEMSYSYCFKYRAKNDLKTIYEWLYNDADRYLERKKKSFSSCF